MAHAGHVPWEGAAALLSISVTSDEITFDWPPQPAWQLSGDWCHIGGTRGPANVQPVPHETMELFGEINDPSIEVMEVKYDGEWHAYEVSQPGFFVRIPGLDEVPSAYRWLDGTGDVVLEAGKVAIPEHPPTRPNVAAVGRTRWVLCRPIERGVAVRVSACHGPQGR
ncbi:MAG: hypothetical protein U5Q44_02705 [Dehalococcoidia bacterium]|nr:hypothetical protein [Dehalococcoidia bacterium]